MKKPETARQETGLDGLQLLKSSLDLTPAMKDKGTALTLSHYIWG